jgi:hypothetical protein
MTNAYKVLVSKPEGNKPHGRPMTRWQDNIKMNSTCIEYEAEDLILLLRTGISVRIL